MPTVFLPSVLSTSTPKLPMAEQAANTILRASWQQRKNPRIHPLLMKAAQYKAMDMQTRKYYSHTSPTGETPNEYVRKHGYRLPDYYPKKGNNVESICLGGKTAEIVIRVWLESPSHHQHIAGTTDFYRGQTAIGVGQARAANGQELWVFLSAPDIG